MNLSTSDIQFSYAGGSALRFPDIALEAGQQALLLGQSGSGKTTLLHLMAGLLRPQSGSVRLGGTDMYGMSETQLDSFRGRHIGLIFQVPHFVRALTVGENLSLAQKLAGVSEDDDLIDQMLDLVGLSAKKARKMHQLSQGEKQRVSIIRGLIHRPKLILADEPTSALDDANCEAVINLISNEAEKIGASLIVVTHDNRLTSRFSHQIRLNS